MQHGMVVQLRSFLFCCTVVWLSSCGDSDNNRGDDDEGSGDTALASPSGMQKDMKPKLAPKESEFAFDTDAAMNDLLSDETFEEMRKRLEAAKPEALQKQMLHLKERYDLSDAPLTGVTMIRTKPVQGGVRVKLPSNMTWEKLAEMTPDAIRENNLFPVGFMPLPHPNHKEGGQVFPAFHIAEIKKQEGRDLQRFDLDLDLPEHFLPEFPPAIFLTSRPDLGDVAKGQLVTNQNFFELFNAVLTPKQLDGLRLLVSPLAQQQFNLTFDRRSLKPHLGVTCFDCHANGHTNAATHLDPQSRPQENRRRLDTPSLRGLNIQRLFGSQRALKTVEDFTEFEQRAAYFDGDPIAAVRKGMRPLERGSEVASMGEFQALLDFPPAPKLDLNGKLRTALASASETRGQELFFGKAQCAGCHVPPFYTDNLMHNLQTERFFTPRDLNGRLANQDGPIKTFPLRGLKDSPPYLHDGRLLTIADTVEFFNLVLGTNLKSEEKADLVAFLLVL